MVSIKAVESIQSSVSTSEKITDFNQQAEFIAGDHREQFLAQREAINIEEIAGGVMAVEGTIISRTEPDRWDKISELIKGLSKEQINEVFAVGLQKKLSEDESRNLGMMYEIVESGYINPAKTGEVEYKNPVTFNRHGAPSITINQDDVIKTLEHLDNRGEANIRYAGGTGRDRSKSTEVIYNPENGNISITVTDKDDDIEPIKFEATLNKDGSWSAPSEYDAKQASYVIDTLSETAEKPR